MGTNTCFWSLTNYFWDKYLPTANMSVSRGRGGGQVVSVSTFYSMANDTSSNPAEAYSFSVKFALEMNKKRPVLTYLKTFKDYCRCTTQVIISKFFIGIFTCKKLTEKIITSNPTRRISKGKWFVIVKTVNTWDQYLYLYMSHSIMCSKMIPCYSLENSMSIYNRFIYQDSTTKHQIQCHTVINVIGIDWNWIGQMECTKINT